MKDYPPTLDSAIQSLNATEPTSEAIEAAQRQLMDRLTSEQEAVPTSRHAWGLATAAAIMAILILPLVLLLPTPGQGVAFAHVQSFFSSFSTLRAELTTTMNEQVLVEMVVRVDESDRARVDLSNQFTLVVDPVLGRMMQIDHHGGERRVFPLDSSQAHEGQGALDWLEDIRTFQGEARRLDGFDRVRGEDAIGFQLEIAGQVMTLWATQVGRPLQLMIQADANEAARIVTQIDFFFDESMDAAWFSITP